MTSQLRLRYQTIEIGAIDIHLCTLRDKQQFSDPDGRAKAAGIGSAQWSLFGILWPSSLVLAHYINDYQTSNKRILEVGCGMALSSLLLNKKNADISATDYHPEVGQFLERNTQLNSGKIIPYEQADWSNDTSQLGGFDLIIGSDLLYEDQHILQLAQFIENHANPACEVIIVDPGRGRKNKLRLQMQQYGFSNSTSRPTHANNKEPVFKGHILKFWRNADSVK